MDCPCCSGLTYDQCCKSFHLGKEPPTSLDLMRSRYSAYALGFSMYIQKTTHPKSPYFEKDLTHWKRGIEEFCRTTLFIKLEILGFEDNWVSFAAHLKQSEQSFVLQELSHFEKVNSNWKYVSGDFKISE